MHHLQTSISQGLRYRIYLPGAPYHRLFQSIVEVQGKPQFAFERLIPRKGAEVLFNLQGSLTGRFPDSSARIDAGEFVLKGNQEGVFDSYLEGQVHFLAVTLTPLGFRELLDFPPADLTNAYVANFPVAGLPQIAQRIQDAATFGERVAVLLDWVRRRVRDNRPDALSAFLERTISEHPHYDGRALEKRTGYTTKYLNKRFKQYTGYTVAGFRRLCRFQGALEQIKTAGFESWADIAYTHNYYDQSHFIRECQSFTGLTPTALQAQLRKAHFNLPFDSGKTE